MFHDNQALSISGDDPKALQAAVELMVRLGESWELHSYKIDPKLGLSFHNGLAHQDGLIPIDKQDCNHVHIAAIISMWLSSQAYRDALHEAPNAFDGGDGSSHKGWLLMSADGMEYEARKAFGDHVSVVVLPYWTYYGK